MKYKLNSIIEKLNKAGKMSFLDSVSDNDILEFERNNSVKLPSELREWYLYSDGGELFLPAGIQLYGIKHKPIIDIKDSDKPNDNYCIIGRLADGEPILCEKNSDKIYIYNHKTGIIESDETFSSFFEFLDALPVLLGITES